MEIEKDKLVCYHANCLDGFAAAYAAWCYFGESAHYIPVQYGTNICQSIFDYLEEKEGYDIEESVDAMPLLMEFASLHIVDFSISIEELEDLSPYIDSIFIIDHHETAYKKLALFNHRDIRKECTIQFIFDNEKSGVVLTWEHFFPNLAPPIELLMIQDRDLWQFKYEDTKSFTLGLFLEKTDFVHWDSLFHFRIMSRNKRARDRYNPSQRENGETLRLITKGHILLEKQKSDINILTRHPQTRVIKGFVAAVVNANRFHISDIGEALGADYPFVAIFSINLFKNKLDISLRSNKSNKDCVNVAKIAEFFNGGGHANAAGFSVPLDQNTLKWLNNERSL